MPRRLPAKPPAVGPLATPDARADLFKVAGLTPERQGELLRAAVETANSAMTGAMHPLAPAVEDWHARLSAARFLAQLLGAQPSRTQAAPSGGEVRVVIEMPEWAQPPAAPRPVGRSSTSVVQAPASKGL